MPLSVSLGFPLSVILSLCLRFRSIILLNSILSQVHNEPWRSTWTSITATGCKICRREKHRGQEEGLKKTPVQPLPVIACRVEDSSSDRMLQRSTDLLNSESFEPANELDWKLSHQSPGPTYQWRQRPLSSRECTILWTLYGRSRLGLWNEDIGMGLWVL